MKSHPESAFKSNLGEGFKVSDGAVVGGLEGVHSHKKVGFKGCGNDSASLALTDGSLTTKDMPAERRRNNLEPASSLTALFQKNDQSPTTQECTFKPAVRQPTKDMHVAREYLSEPAWLRLSRPRPETPQQEERELQECTFKPAVRQPTKDMHVAREYLSEPAWLRLSRPRWAGESYTLFRAYISPTRSPLGSIYPVPVTPQQSADMAQLPGGRAPSPGPGKAGNKSGGGGGGPGASPRQASQRGGSSEAPNSARAGGGGVQRQSSDGGGANFDAFLERQENFVRKMEYNLERRLLEEEAEAKKGLQLCQRSLQIVRRKERQDGGIYVCVYVIYMVYVYTYVCMGVVCMCAC